MISALRASLRVLLQAWGWTGKGAGWRYKAIERWGAKLATSGPDGLHSILPNGLTITTDLRDEVQRQIYFWGCYEPYESFIFLQLVQPGMTVVDAGANVGNYTLLAATATGDQGHIYAFEPVPATCARLRGAVTANRLNNVTVNQTALWSFRTSLNIGLPRGHEGNAGAYSVGGAGVSISAPAEPLDLFLAQVGAPRVDIIKMDIEGSELHALQGMHATLMRDHPLLLMEVNREAAESVGSSLAQLGDLLLKKLGYRAWRLDIGAQVEALDSIERANVLFYVGDTPTAVCGAASIRQAIRWARSGRASGLRQNA